MKKVILLTAPNSKLIVLWQNTANLQTIIFAAQKK
jgi:hypothetical protein